MRAVLDIILLILQIYIWLLIAAAILSWLIAFNVVNTRNQAVHMIGDMLYRLTEPLLRPLHGKLIAGNIDFGPMAVMIVLLLARLLIAAPLLDLGARLAMGA